MADVSSLEEPTLQRPRPKADAMAVSISNAELVHIAELQERSYERHVAAGHIRRIVWGDRRG